MVMAREYRTRSKDEILAYLKMNKDKRFRACDIFDFISEQGGHINRTTIYRNLDRLTESGELLKFKETGEDSCLYQYSDMHGRCASHMHAQCKNCGSIIHLESEAMHSILEEMMRDYGFAVDLRHSMITGLCKECSAG